jgi:hypothetical protein
MRPLLLANTRALSRTRETRIRGIAIVRADFVDALRSFSKERRSMRWRRAGVGQAECPRSTIAVWRCCGCRAASCTTRPRATVLRSCSCTGSRSTFACGTTKCLRSTTSQGWSATTRADLAVRHATRTHLVLARRRSLAAGRPSRDRHGCTRGALDGWSHRGRGDAGRT